MYNLLCLCRRFALINVQLIQYWVILRPISNWFWFILCHCLMQTIYGSVWCVLRVITQSVIKDLICLTVFVTLLQNWTELTFASNIVINVNLCSLLSDFYYSTQWSAKYFWFHSSDGMRKECVNRLVRREWGHCLSNVSRDCHSFG